MSSIEKILREELTGEFQISDLKSLEARLTQLLLFEKANRKYERQRGSKGFIYLIRDADGYYKIGRATNLQVRLRKYYSENAKGVTLVANAYVDGYIQKEIDLQKMFEDKHYRGEWFELNEDDAEKIKSTLKKWGK